MVFFFFVGGGPRAILFSVAISVISMLFNSNLFTDTGSGKSLPAWEDDLEFFPPQGRRVRRQPSEQRQKEPGRGTRRAERGAREQLRPPAAASWASTLCLWTPPLLLLCAVGYACQLLAQPERARSPAARQVLRLAEKVYDALLRLQAFVGHEFQQWAGEGAGAAGRRQSERTKAKQQEVSKLPIESFADEAALLRWSAGQLKDELRRLRILSEMKFGRFSGGSAARETHHFLRAGGAVEKKELVDAVLKARGGESGLSCAVCLATYTSGEKLRVLPCGHRFHVGCVDRWLLQQSRTCPLCAKAI